MFKVNRLLKQSAGRAKSVISTSQSLNQNGVSQLPVPTPSSAISVRFLNFYEVASKDAVEKERARIKDEMSRSYFADMFELRKHGGKVTAASKVIIPDAEAVKCPGFEVNYPDGRKVKLPVVMEGSEAPKATLLCFSFRANSKAIISSWSTPFFEEFKHSQNAQLYEVSFIDSWFLTLYPVKRLLLRAMKRSNSADPEIPLQSQSVYSFGDHYYFRKELRILNLFTGYAFLVDKFGRIRWQGTGEATDEEVSSLISSASQLLEEK